MTTPTTTTPENETIVPVPVPTLREWGRRMDIWTSSIVGLLLKADSTGPCPLCGGPAEEESYYDEDEEEEIPTGEWYWDHACDCPSYLVADLASDLRALVTRAEKGFFQPVLEVHGAGEVSAL